MKCSNPKCKKKLPYNKELFYDKKTLKNNLLNSKRAYYPLLIKKPETHSSFKNFSPRDSLSVIYKDKNGKNIVLNGVVLKKERIRSKIAKDERRCRKNESRG